MIAASFLFLAVGLFLAQMARINDCYGTPSGYFLLAGMFFGILGIAKWLWEVAP